MRSLPLVVAALALSSCSTLSVSAEAQMRTETVRLEPTGDLSLRAGDYVEVSGFLFDIGFKENATDLSTPNSVTWSIGFRNYCRNRDSWVQSIVGGPSGQVWRGYRVFVPAGSNHPQHWSNGGSGSAAYGGPATPGILEAAAQGGRFILAIEDDEGQRWNAVAIETLTPSARNQLFSAQHVSQPRQSEMLQVRSAALGVPQSPQSCPQ